MGSSGLDLLAELEALRAKVAAEGQAVSDEWDVAPEDISPALMNLAHYIALRRNDLRDLQMELTWRGLSSLGRLESRVLPSLDAVIGVLARCEGRETPLPQPSQEQVFAGARRLNECAAALFGKPPENRQARIMVTLSTEAAEDYEHVLRLAKAGMNVARINCAHDSADAWRVMAAHVKKAGKSVGRAIPVLMDIAGPKIRTRSVLACEKKARILIGERFALCANAPASVQDGLRFAADTSVPDLVSRLRPGDRVLYDDLKLRGRVESVAPDGATAIIRIEGCKEGGVKLKPEKGLNVPDTPLGLSPLTAKDRSDLDTVLECADMIGYSFVSSPADIDLLEDALAERGRRRKSLGLIAKIERPEAVENLPELIARALPRRPFGVMIARGDLAAELGFERLAEMQEEILWLCEAASVPVIWATQVLEGLVKDGSPTRGEMTDAAMSARAECVMLNKGPAIVEAVELLDRLIMRMEGHMLKKTPRLRALKSW